jgi:hypothetical protein
MAPRCPPATKPTSSSSSEVGGCWGFKPSHTAAGPCGLQGSSTPHHTHPLRPCATAAVVRRRGHSGPHGYEPAPSCADKVLSARRSSHHLSGETPLPPAAVAGQPTATLSAHSSHLGQISLRCLSCSFGCQMQPVPTVFLPDAVSAQHVLRAAMPVAESGFRLPTPVVCRAPPPPLPLVVCMADHPTMVHHQQQPGHHLCMAG